MLMSQSSMFKLILVATFKKMNVKKMYVISVVSTWDRLGWWELHRVLVSTCSGTKPRVLRTCRASLSLSGPKCGWITVFASVKGVAYHKTLMHVNIKDVQQPK